MVAGQSLASKPKPEQPHLLGKVDAMCSDESLPIANIIAVIEIKVTLPGAEGVASLFICVSQLAPYVQVPTQLELNKTPNC